VTGKVVTTATDKWVGQSVLRFEDAALLTGGARFIDDLEPVAGLRHAAILRSPHAHADIVSIDADKARQLPGVIGVLTGADVAAIARPIGNLITRKLSYYPCAVGRVRYFGEPVAVVVAEDRYIAEDALDLIEVSYRPRAAVVDPEVAFAEGAPVLHDELGSNVVHTRSFRYGDPDLAFRAADKVVSVKVPYPRVNSTPIETYGVIADYDSGSGRYTVWSNFQGPYALHPIMCDALGVRSHQLRLIAAPASGGSFGIKQGVYPYIVLIGLASRAFDCAVKWVEDRIEHLAASSASSGRVTSMDGAFAADGTLLALRLRQVENVGAYLRPPDPAALYRMHSTLSGPYRVRHLAVDNQAVVTNQVPSGLNRGFGGPQFFFPLERLMDRAARTLGIDPAELRRRNLVRADEFPYQTPAGSLLDSGNYQGCLALALQKIGYDALRVEQEAARRDGRMLGLGVACAVETSASNMAYVNLALSHEQRSQSLPKSGASGNARVTMDPLGSVIVHIDSVPNGQGHSTAVAQIVADELGVKPQEVAVVSDLDTLHGPWSITSGNYANRFSAVVSSAVALAARAAAGKLKAVAARMLGVAPNAVELANGMASAPGARNEPIPIRRLAAQLHWDSSNPPHGVNGAIAETVEFSPAILGVPDERDRLRSSLTYTFQCDVGFVEVDRNTGRVHVLRYVTVHDVGNMLNPALVEGQIHGGFAHGFGAGMMERVTYGADGTLLTGTFQDYLCPTASELPDLEIGHVATPTPNNVHGCKGLGDGCSMIAPVTLANAIADAVGLEELVPPFMPGRVWQRLQGRNPDAVETAPAQDRGQDRADKFPAFPGGFRGEGQVVIDALPAQVWQALIDPQSLRAVIPGCEHIEETGPDSYRAAVRISVAGIGGTYDVHMRLFDRHEPERMRLSGRAESRLGFGEGEAIVTLAALPEGRTRLTYCYVAAIGGKLAGFGQRMLDGVVRMLLASFFERLGAHLRGEEEVVDGGLIKLLRDCVTILRLLVGRS
jgi:2-furoyl-CoA dehydrogenase large subunit